METYILLLILGIQVVDSRLAESEALQQGHQLFGASGTKIRHVCWKSKKKRERKSKITSTMDPVHSKCNLQCLINLILNKGLDEANHFSKKIDP